MGRMLREFHALVMRPYLYESLGENQGKGKISSEEYAVRAKPRSLSGSQVIDQGRARM